MHTCTATSNCKNRASPLLSRSAGWAVCCVVRSPEGPGWPWTGLGGLQSQLGQGLPALVTVSLREGRKRKGKGNLQGCSHPEEESQS